MTDRIQCRYCTASFAPKSEGDMFCSRNCARFFHVGHKAVWPRGATHGVCQVCRTLFEIPRTSRKQMTCSSECAKRMTLCGRRKNKACVVCGASLLTAVGAKIVCSAKCSETYKAEKDLKSKVARFGPPRTCRRCQKAFTYHPDAYKDFCSSICRIETRKDEKKRMGHERRARQASVTFEQFSPTYILKRDKYICQACGAKTKPNAKPTDPLYPNVDHIVPLSMGGDHSKKNCRCVCSSCNSKKCNRTLNDQLLLFG